ncbi:IS3 family transposase [Nocardia sp. NPDC051756]|uniref:IS3 family transposase n=1 Tax=Nocardia sp. NPDC051756 TaxID=3154751 RepID=UPI003428A6A8
MYTSWAFGQRIRSAGLLGSMGSIGDCVDNSMVESYFGSMQLELLDTRKWNIRRELANAIFDYIEAFYNPTRRHSKLDMLSPVDYERAHTAAHRAASSPHPPVRESGATLDIDVLRNAG